MSGQSQFNLAHERQKPPLKIAVLLNSYRSPFIQDIRESYVRSIRNVSPSCTLSFFLPAENAEDFPDPEEFDLIVVGGGNADPRKKHQWILRVHKFILDVVTNHPGKKICGICWGHQTIALLFGGVIVDMDVPELGVTEAKLTPLGKRFFASYPVEEKQGLVRLQQHHRRAVGGNTPPNGFSELLAGNQAFLSHNGSVITFQGHPEKDAHCAKLRVRDALRWYGFDPAEKGAEAEEVLRQVERDMERQHDGAEIWAGVFDWVRGDVKGLEMGMGMTMQQHL
ncbi:class I glutamine amidotransferase-like protein [Podospora australis]|uniref:Class I glutamine amidotransferase-like protein n=1 Tax=Podospora australis TaxID=1536484 RepID=A0AAN6WUT0_9PEZI|nr:class I glutamine amidotransferase-like protein [Podospora australis]